MEFWLIMIGFIVMGGSCSLAGTWWDRKNKKDKKNGRICLSFIISNCQNSVTKQRFRHLSCQEKQRNLVII